ncbi:hypothetical protein [Dapis sp. BLCC M126]|uniref:hypothetical protein n=1 Tax=Dapis sp. BLCC M126 TaxID=3400189 RepID=UPI003CF437E3
MDKISAVDSVAFGYLNEYDLENNCISLNYVIENLFENMPLLRSVIKTDFGKIGAIILP